MKPPIPYKPAPIPADLPASAKRFLNDELNRIAAVLQALMQVSPSPSTLQLDATPTQPATPVSPVIVYTDGTTWDPGSGEGYYYFNMHGVWTPLG